MSLKNFSVNVNKSTVISECVLTYYKNHLKRRTSVIAQCVNYFLKLSSYEVDFIYSSLGFQTKEIKKVFKQVNHGQFLYPSNILVYTFTSILKNLLSSIYDKRFLGCHFMQLNVRFNYRGCCSQTFTFELSKLLESTTAAVRVLLQFYTSPNS